MIKRLKVVAEFNDETQKALLIQIPKKMIGNISINKDSTMNTEDFLDLLFADDELEEECSINFMELIYGTSFLRKSNKVQEKF